MAVPLANGHPIGTIVSSISHTQYHCQVYTEHENAHLPQPIDFSFGRFVRIDFPQLPNTDTPAHLIGIIYDTVLMNPSFGTLGPRLSASEEQRAIFSPDYLSERATIVSILALGSYDPDTGFIEHGIPALALELGAVVLPLSDDAVRNFHLFADEFSPAPGQPYLHMGYLSQLVGQPHGTLPHVAIRIITQLKSLLPREQRLLTIIHRNVLWKLSIEPAG